MSPRLAAKTFALVLPTLNEAGNIERVLTQVSDALQGAPYDYQIIVVDDGSTDGTVTRVEKWSERDSRVRVVSRTGAKGLAGAVLHGWAQCNADLLGVMDADLQHPAELLPQLLKETERCDIAIASRYAIDDGTKGWNPIRSAISRLSTLAASPFISKKNLGVTDPMSGFFFVRRDCLDGIVFQQTGFKLLLEILVRARISSVREIPFAFGQRYRGASKANVRVAIDYGRLLARLYRSRFGFSRVITDSAFD